MINWTLKEVSIKDIKDFNKNPRKITKDELARLQENIKKFGLIDKPILNSDFTLIGGHQRLKVLRRMKVKKVECWVADQLLSEKDFEQLCIQLNKNTGDWDYDILANQWEVSDLLSWGFKEEELFGAVNKAVEEIENDEKEEKKKKKHICPSCGHEFN